MEGLPKRGDAISFWLELRARAAEDFTKDVGFTSGNIGLTHNTPLPDDGSPGYKCPCFYPDVDPEDEWGTCACGHHGEVKMSMMMTGSAPSGSLIK